MNIYNKIVCFSLTAFVFTFSPNRLLAQKNISVVDVGGYTVYKGIEGDAVYTGTEKRFALVIGQVDYKYQMKLPNDQNDVDDMCNELQKAGFDVIKLFNQTKD